MPRTNEVMWSEQQLRKVDTEPSKESSLKTLQRELKAAWESLRDVGTQLQKSSIRLEAYHQIDVSNSKISWMDFEAYFIETGKAEDEALMKKIAAMTPETREDIRSRILTTIPLTESEKSRVANRACSFGKMHSQEVIQLLLGSSESSLLAKSEVDTGTLQLHMDDLDTPTQRCLQRIVNGFWWHKSVSSGPKFLRKGDAVWAFVVAPYSMCKSEYDHDNASAKQRCIHGSRDGTHWLPGRIYGPAPAVGHWIIDSNGVLQTVKETNIRREERLEGTRKMTGRIDPRGVKRPSVHNSLYHNSKRGKKLIWADQRTTTLASMANPDAPPSTSVKKETKFWDSDMDPDNPMK